MEQKVLKDQNSITANLNSKGKNILEVSSVSKSFKVGTQDIQVLKNVSVNIKEGDFVILVGQSGCGKSTLLHILLGLEEPSTGSITFLGQDLYKGKDEDTRSDFRKKSVGMVFQQSNWIRCLNVQENVAFPLLLLGYEKPKAMITSLEMLKKVHMEDWAKYMPTELSSGQQQRVGLARALVNDPVLIVADEPTGNLDYDSGQTVMKIFYDLNKISKKTIIMVTHDLEYVRFGSCVIRMLDGEILGIYTDENKDKLLSEIKYKRLGDVAKKNADLEENLTTVSGTELINEEKPVPVKKPNIFKINTSVKVGKIPKQNLGDIK